MLIVAILFRGEPQPMNQGSIRVVAKIEAVPGKGAVVREILRKLIEPTRKESGCVTYELWQNRSDDADFTFVEVWASEAELDAHAASQHLKDVAAELRGLITRPAEVRRYDLIY